MAKKKANDKKEALKSDSEGLEVNDFEQLVEEVITEDSEGLEADEYAQRAIVSSIVEDSLMDALIADVQTSMAAGYRPEYVTSDGNCFEKKAFAWAVDHIRDTNIKLYRVVYNDAENTFRLKLME